MARGLLDLEAPYHGNKVAHAQSIVGREFRARIAVKGLRFCGPCQTIKHHTEFQNNRAAPDGLNAECKICHKARMRAVRKRWIEEDKTPVGEYYGID
jgi:hypothetical protein